LKVYSEHACPSRPLGSASAIKFVIKLANVSPDVKFVLYVRNNSGFFNKKLVVQRKIFVFNKKLGSVSHNKTGGIKDITSM